MATSMSLTARILQFIRGALVSGLMLVVIVCAQAQARQTTQAPDSIFINVNNPFTEKFAIRGLTSTFPYPILTTISVLDEHGKHISGLADTLDWVGPQERANNGRLVREIWTPLLEFYQSDSTLPPEPDLYQQVRDPLFTEIRELLEVPTSTMLVMDMSESMQTVIDSVRDALEAFVASMRDVDRGAVLQFSDNNKIHIIRPFMSDRQRLQNGVNSGIPKGRTALYDALGKAIQATRQETSARRAIIAYTDGVDNHSLLYTPESVIDSANVYRIPIYMIALGDSLNVEPLIQIAEGTGGIFFRAAGPREMPGIYRQLSVLIKNYYVMAHQSSDSLYNNTVRTVTVQVNTSAGSVRGRGTYYVPGPDMSLVLRASADSSAFFDAEEHPAAMPGDTIGLFLHWRNNGDFSADSLTLDLRPAWPVAAVDSSRMPVHAGSLLRWRLAPLAVQSQDSLSLRVIMPDSLSPDSLLQIFSASITTRNEFPGPNNFARDSVVILHAQMPP
ncbi:MAG TPA: VWA domain-containing protein, partial [Bacteroidetes bacterium]|nr:VWA domain-containing protein [Bacteroidota bacterium]